MKNRRILLFSGLLGMSLLWAGKSYSQFRSEQSLNTYQPPINQSVLSETSESQPPSSTPSPIATEKPSTVSVIATATPTPSNTQPTVSNQSGTESDNEGSSTANTEAQNAANSPGQDPSAEYLLQQQQEIQAKMEYCKTLYSEVTVSIQPLLDKRDSISQNLLEAINKGDWDKVSYYQQQQAEVQAQVNAAYDQYYYPFCP